MEGDVAEMTKLFDSKLMTACDNFYNSWFGKTGSEWDRNEFRVILYDFVRLWQTADNYSDAQYLHAEDYGLHWGYVRL